MIQALQAAFFILVMVVTVGYVLYQLRPRR